MAQDIFISYSRKDIETVRPIKDELEARVQSECWMDLVEGIDSSSRAFDEDIVNGIKSCSIFFFALSNNSQQSEFAINELELALKKQKEDPANRHVVLVNIDGCKMTDTFYLRYSRRQNTDWNVPEQKDKLIRDLRRWLKKGAEPKPTPRPTPVPEPTPSPQPKPSTWKIVGLCFAGLAVLTAVFFLLRGILGPGPEPDVQPGAIVEPAVAEESQNPTMTSVKDYGICDDKGEVLYTYTGALLDYDLFEDCRKCDASGVLLGKVCPTCNGTGKAKVQGVPSGLGKAVYPDGRIYEGPFMNGMRHGKGATFGFSDGNVFKGSFEYDHLKKGRLTSVQEDSKGVYFEGSFSDDKPYDGGWFDADGEQFGTVKNGKQV